MSICDYRMELILTAFYCDRTFNKISTLPYDLWKFIRLDKRFLEE